MDKQELLKMKSIIERFKKHIEKDRNTRKMYKAHSLDHSYYWGSIETMKYAIDTLENNFIHMPAQLV